MGWDQGARDGFREAAVLESDSSRWAWWWVGALWHLLLGVGLVVWSRTGEERDVAGQCGKSVLWALAVVFAVVLVLKVVTGRYGPHLTNDAVGSFHVLELTWGRSWMKWPSGHTATAFAAAAAVHVSLPGRRVLHVLAYGTATLVGLSMLAGCFHWLSDVLAGGILGVVVTRVALAWLSRGDSSTTCASA